MARGWQSFLKRRSTIVTLVAVGATLVLIAILTLTLPYNSPAAALLLDRHRFSVFPYPFTIQNMTYVLCALGLATLFNRWEAARREEEFLYAELLPEDSSSVLQISELGPLRRKVANLYDGESGFLPYLIDITITQLQASRSVDQAVAILTSSLDLMTHRVDLRYQMVRYIGWLIPTVGFIGTVIGIAVALEFINPAKLDLGAVTGGLAVAFYTTLVALIVSAIVMFFQHLVQKKEEAVLNEAGQYCLKNLINRVYVPREEVGSAA
jgi:biopolymer transport protein ExbB/TolQ